MGEITGNGLIQGTRQKDIIRGGDGDDVIYGFASGDGLHGGKGNDTIYGGLGGDFIFGEDGNDFLYGDEGNDFITGGLGRDEMWGGAGRDVFKYSSHLVSSDALDAEGRSLADIIHDFETGKDKLDFGSVDANVDMPLNNSFTLVPYEQGRIYNAGDLTVQPHGLGWRVDAHVDSDGIPDLTVFVYGTFNPAVDIVFGP